MEKIVILVLCTGNSCRSQMAEGFFREYGWSDVEVYSAGLTAHGVNSRAVQVMSEVGIDIGAHRSESLETYLSMPFDYVITVCDTAAKSCPVFPGPARRLHWPFRDPALASGSEDEVMAEFREVRDQIGRAVKDWLNDRFTRTDSI